MLSKKIKHTNHKLPSLSVVFPAFNDQYSIPILIENTMKILPIISTKSEIIVVNDGSEDETKKVLNNLASKHKIIRVIHHKKNKGYGGAIKSGFQAAQMEYIFYTDGDCQYDILEIYKLVNKITSNIDFVTGYKLERSDFFYRKWLGSLYAKFNRQFFGIKIRDINCDFRLFKSRILAGMDLEIESGAFDLEFIKKVEEGGFNIREVGVHHYPRPFGSSQALRPNHLITSFLDMLKIVLSQAKYRFSKQPQKSKISKVIV